MANILFVHIFNCFGGGGGGGGKEPTTNNQFLPFSYTEILHMYRGLFFNEKQMVEREQKILSARKKDLNNEGLNASKVLGLPGDGDSCCAT